MKRAILLFILSAGCVFATAESKQVLRAPVWIYLETVPGNNTMENPGPPAPSVEELDRIARFILGGMLYFPTRPEIKSAMSPSISRWLPLKKLKLAIHG
jgi:hypothetical protein